MHVKNCIVLHSNLFLTEFQLQQAQLVSNCGGCSVCGWFLCIIKAKSRQRVQRNWRKVVVLFMSSWTACFVLIAEKGHHIRTYDPSVLRNWISVIKVRVNTKLSSILVRTLHQLRSGRHIHVHGQTYLLACGSCLGDFYFDF